MPRPKWVSRGLGFRAALIGWLVLFGFLITFYQYVARTQYVTFSYAGNKVGTAFLYESPYPVTRPAPIVLYIHGYNNLKTYEPRVVEFTRIGWDVLAIDLPGFGTNAENFSSGCWNVIFGALDYIQSNPQSWNASAIGVVGYSFGGLVAADGDNV